MKFEHQISEGTYHTYRAWDRRTLLFLLYNAQFWVKIAENGHYLNNRVFLSKAPSCDRLPEEIWCSQQILAGERSSKAYMKFEHQISEENYHT